MLYFISEKQALEKLRNSKVFSQLLDGGGSTPYTREQKLHLVDLLSNPRSRERGLIVVLPGKQVSDHYVLDMQCTKHL